MNGVARFPGDFFDGHSAAMRRVEVVVDGRAVLIRGEDVLRLHSVRELRIPPRIARIPLRIGLPDGAIVVADADAVAAALPIPAAAGLAHRLESRLAVVLAALAGLAAAAWFGYHDGIPWLAKQVAQRIPPSLEAQIANDGLDSLDHIAFRPTKLDAARRERLRGLFAQLAAPLGPAASGARLEFRDGGWIGANAFALPGGVVVMTDQLAGALPDDEHVVAVLAHELGHLEHRHGARTMLQGSIAGLASLALFGDASSVGTLAATVPTALVQTSYSRDFEREADAFAFSLLRRTGRSPRLFAAALTALEKARPARGQECHAKGEAEEKRTGDERDESSAPPADDDAMLYLSTHPATRERALAAEQAAQAAGGER